MEKNIRWTEEGNLGVIDSIKISLESLVTSTLERTDRSRRVGNSFSRSRRENDLRAAVSLDYGLSSNSVGEKQWFRVFRDISPFFPEPK